MPIHPTAVIDPRAELDSSVEVGPHVVIEAGVRIGPRTRVLAGAFLTGLAEIGADNVIHPHAVIGHEPQDLAYRGAPTGLRIGAGNVFREHVEIHRATQPETWTEIGDGNYLMSHTHVAHNCRLGDRIVMATGAMLGGHVVLEDQVFLSGNVAVHQHCRVGRLSIMRGMARATVDVPPFAIFDGTSTVRGLNRVGLQRAGFDAARIAALAKAFRILFRVRVNLRMAMARVEAEVSSPDVEYLLAFLRSARRGGAAGPPARHRRDRDDAD